MNTLLLANLDTWWADLAGAHRFFLLVGIASGIVATFLTVGGLVGFGHDAPELHADHGDSSDTAEAFSVRAITGFFLGFGWIGAIAIASGTSIIVASLCALAAGSAMMFGVRAIMRSMKRLRSDGTVKIGDAAGATGTVYVTIPPAGAAGGQATVTFDNRNETMPAVQTGGAPLPAGTRIRVTAVQGRTLTVERI
jgi:membrane protein implicated in regulation of membrane protease activity